MGYRIKYFYDTGSTFSSETDVEDFLTVTLSERPWSKIYVWERIEDAQEVLRRMKEHYEWYASMDGYRKEDPPPPKWWSGTYKDKYSATHFNGPGNTKGKEEKFCTSTYCGYFESLNSAEIVFEDLEEEQNRFNLKGY